MHFCPSRHWSRSKRAALGGALLLAMSSANANADTCNGALTEQQIATHRGLSLTLIQQLQAQRSLSLADLCVISEKKLRRAIERVHHPKPDRPGEAMRFRRLHWQDEQGHVAEHGLVNAQKQVKRMQKQPLAAELARGQWQWQGPGNIGGRIRSLLIHPSNAQTLWAGSVGGGIWTTTNGGASWRPVDDFMTNLAVTTMVMHPTNTNRLYAGTGEGFFNADAIRGAGIFRSDDGGVNWQQLTSTNNSHFHYVNRLAVSANGQIMIAATNRGLFRSTDDGDSWTAVTPSGISDADRFLDLDFHPSDSSRVIAADDDIGVVYSSNGGQTWSKASGFSSPERVEIAYASSNPQVVYASAQVNNGEVWKSTDGGQSFSRVAQPKHTGSQGWYDNVVWVDPSNADRVVVGGIDLWRSTNGGSSFTKFSTWWQAPESAHADQHTVVAHPQFNGTSNNTVFVGNDGGVYRIDNVFTALGDSGFTELNNQLGITQFYGVAAAPDGKITGGTQDNGHLVKQGDAESWVASYGGDGGFAAVDPTDSNYVYGEYVNLQIHRSTNGGRESSSGQIASEEMTNDGANFIAPFILDPNNPNVMLAGATRLWRSINVKAATPSWTDIKAASGTRPISAIAVAKGNSNLIWVGHNNGELYKSTNGGNAAPSWSRVGAGNLPSRYLTRIAVDPNNLNTVYVAYGGFNSDNLYKTTDGGANWQAVTAGLPAAPIRGIAIKPDNSQYIYVGTEVGVFASENGGSSWGLPHDGPANVSVDELVWMNTQTLVAATHGRGIYLATLGNSSDDDEPDPVQFAAQTQVALNSIIQSNTVTVNGINVPITISITNGEYSLGCNGSFSQTAATVQAGTRLCLRHTSAVDYDTTTTTTLWLGNTNFSFASTTRGDSDPDAFSFPAQTNVPMNTTVTSTGATITGLVEATEIRVSGGEYSLGCGTSFTTATSSISNNQRVCVRHQTASTHDSSVTTTLTIGNRSATFRSTTLAADRQPDAFVFTAQTAVALNTPVQSNTVTINGINVSVAVTVQGGEYSVGCNGSFTSGAGTVSNGQTICLRHVSATGHASSVTTALSVGERSASFISTTFSADDQPDVIAFTALTDVALSSNVQSNAVTITGLNVPVSINVQNGEYSVDCNNSFTSNPGTLNSGQTLCLRHISAATHATTVTTSVTVGTRTASFQSTTLVADSSPEVLVFARQRDVPLNRAVQSETLVVRGINVPVAIRIQNGEYSLGCDGTFTTVAASVQPNTQLCLRHTSAASFATDTTTTLMLGNTPFTFVSTTKADNEPDTFMFPPKTGLEPGVSVISDSIVINGLVARSAVSVSGGEYSIGCNGSFTQIPGLIGNGETICVRHQSAASYGSTSMTVLTIGDRTATFESATLIADRLPEAFAFPDRSNVALGSMVQSTTVTISGINVPVALSIQNGEYSLNCNGTFSTAATMIRRGDQLCLRHRASTVSGTAATTTVTVGEFSTPFRSTTQQILDGGLGGGGGGGGALFLLPMMALLPWRRNRKAP